MVQFSLETRLPLPKPLSHERLAQVRGRLGRWHHRLCNPFIGHWCSGRTITGMLVGLDRISVELAAGNLTFGNN